MGAPDVPKARDQFESYCDALKQCGLTLTRLEPDERYPDSTFVEDTAVITEKGVIITRPGATSRLGEVEDIKQVINRYHDKLNFIEEPGTLDGGDVCRAGNHFFIGVSRRTSVDGARQLSAILRALNFGSTLIDIRNLSNILHLKSGLAYIGDNHLVTVGNFSQATEFEGYFRIEVSPTEAYAANCVRINDSILIASGFPSFETRLERLGFKTLSLDVSEFQKMDGGLSCLSLRF